MSDPPPPPLSATELEVLRLVATGATNREIAHSRGISEATVKKHLTNIFAKLGTGNRTEAVRRAMEEGLVSVPTTTAGLVEAADVETAADGLDQQTVHHLARELERTRQRTRRMIGAVVVGATVVVALAWLASYVYVELQPLPAPTGVPTSPAEIQSWYPGINLPSARSGVAAVANPGDGSVLVIGGRSAAGVLGDTLRQSVDGLRWLPMAQKPTPVEGIGAVAVRGAVVVPGGCGVDGRATDVVELYEPGSDRWRRGADLPAPVCGYGLAEVQGEMFLFGGRSNADPASALAEVWRYDSAADRWSAADPMPLPRADLAAVSVGQAIHVLGGRDRSGRLQASHWVYQPFAPPEARWQADGGPVLPEARAGLTAVATAVRSIYVVGGGWDDRLTDSTLALHLASRDPSWEPQAEVPGFTPQRGAGMALVDGHLLVLVGGEADGAALDRQYRWDVVPTTLIFTGPGGLR